MTHYTESPSQNSQVEQSTPLRALQTSQVDDEVAKTDTVPEDQNLDEADLYQDPTDSIKEVQSTVLVIQLETDQTPEDPNVASIPIQTPVTQLIGVLRKKGVAQKFYLNTMVKRTLDCEALIDTAADITLRSSELFDKLLEVMKKSHRTLKRQRCALDIQPYSLVGTQIQWMAPIHLSIDPMEVVHPIHISPINTIPLLVGMDLLNRFEPLIDFPMSCN